MRNSPIQKRRGNIPQQPALFDPRLRYTIPEASALLKQSVCKTWGDIRDGHITPLRDAGRTYVPGSEILKRSALPDNTQPRAA